MQISLEWVKELVNIDNINLDYLVEKLVLGGFEVEEIIKLEINKQQITVLDISSTANRADSLSILGISEEISALLNKPIRTSKYSTYNFSFKKQEENIFEKNKCNKNCSIFLALTIESLSNIHVPKWIKQKLKTSGIEPSNNLLDFQNYLLLETGCPVEFYDLDKILSKLERPTFQLEFSTVKENQEFFANNLNNYNLVKYIPIIKADNLLLSIAGIIGSNEFITTINTKSLLIEFSIFDSKIIRQKSRLIGLRTERSARYEKSLKRTYLLDSVYRLITLLKISNPDLKSTLHTNFQTEIETLSTITLSYNSIKEILGPIKKYNNRNFNYVSPEMISNYLFRLNLPFVLNPDINSWDVTIPISRNEDLVREIDLIEEIGRLHGFNNFLTRLPRIKKIGFEDISYKARKKLISSFLGIGLTELLHYSLVNEKTFFENKISLVNPLFSDCANLRASLLPSLITAVSNNIKQTNSYIEGFEFGHVFFGNNLSTVKESEYVSGVFGGQKTKLEWSEPGRPLTWFEAKGRIERIFKQLNLLTFWVNSNSSDYVELLHTYCTADLYLCNRTKLGTFGQINPSLSNKLNISPQLYLFEFNFENIKDALSNNKLILYREYSSYPKISKDLSFIIDKNITFTDIKKIIFNNGTNYLTEINLLDIYTGKSMPKNHMSLCLQLIFQSTAITLKNKNIENIVLNLQTILKNKFEIIIRD